ncbi:MAG TPA: metallophosphoesterase, partial [candidate division Zixibacteria bacterium]|nr:metallophosphoesterase [candidate division Zixibacteria bacterium]
MSFFMRIVLFTVVLGLIQILMTKYLNRPLWRTRWGKRIVVGWPLASVLALVLWLAAVWTFDGVWWLDSLMRVIAAAFLVGVLALLLSSPVAGLLNAFEALRRRFTMRTAELATETVESPARRSFLQLGAIALPVATISASQSGVLTSFSGVKVFELPVRIPNLPPQLEGLRILHLSDLHLGVFYHLGDLEELLTDLDGRRFDVVALIGDIADNLDDLPTALNLISQLPARYGHYATLGNHEYYRGLDRVLRTYERSPIPLLRNEGVKVDVNGAALVIGGADDPVGMGWSVDRSAFYRGAVENSLDPAAS